MARSLPVTPVPLPALLAPRKPAAAANHSDRFLSHLRRARESRDALIEQSLVERRARSSRVDEIPSTKSDNSPAPAQEPATDSHVAAPLPGDTLYEPRRDGQQTHEPATDFSPPIALPPADQEAPGVESPDGANRPVPFAAPQPLFIQPVMIDAQPRSHAPDAHDAAEFPRSIPTADTDRATTPQSTQSPAQSDARSVEAPATPPLATLSRTDHAWPKIDLQRISDVPRVAAGTDLSNTRLPPPEDASRSTPKPSTTRPAPETRQYDHATQTPPPSPSGRPSIDPSTPPRADMASSGAAAQDLARDPRLATQTLASDATPHDAQRNSSTSHTSSDHTAVNAAAAQFGTRIAAATTSGSSAASPDGRRDTNQSTATPGESANPVATSARGVATTAQATARHEAADTASLRGAAPADSSFARRLDAAAIDRPVSLDRLTDVLGANIAQRRWNVRLQLDPPELGRLHLDVAMRHDALHLRVAVASDEVRRLVESRMSQLVDALRQHDLRVAQTDVVVRTDADNRPDAQPDRRDDRASGQPQDDAGRSWRDPNRTPHESPRDRQSVPDSDADARNADALTPARAERRIAAYWNEFGALNLVA